MHKCNIKVYIDKHYPEDINLTMICPVCEMDNTFVIKLKYLLEGDAVAACKRCNTHIYTTGVEIKHKVEKIKRAYDNNDGYSYYPEYMHARLTDIDLNSVANEIFGEEPPIEEPLDMGEVYSKEKEDDYISIWD